MRIWNQVFKIYKQAGNHKTETQNHNRASLHKIMAIKNE